MRIMCMILSPNCCAETIFEYSTMSRCYLAVCQFWATTLLRKANGRVQISDLLKLAKEGKSAWSALFRGNVCIWSDKIFNVSAILGRKSTARLKVNQNTRSPPLSENLKFRKEWTWLFWGSLKGPSQPPPFSMTSKLLIAELRRPKAAKRSPIPILGNWREPMKWFSHVYHG